MDDTDGPKHCGEARKHFPHEYEVAMGDFGKERFLWSCDGSERVDPGPRRPDPDLSDVKLFSTDISTTFGKVDGEDSFLVVIARTFIVPVDAAQGMGHNATMLALSKDGRR